MRIGMGLHLTQQRRLPYPTVAVLPDDAVGALGDGVYFGGRVYRKRWVGNREGMGDGILFPVNLFPSVGDFDLSVRLRFDNPINSSFLALASGDPWGASSNFAFTIPTPTLPAFNVRGGSPVYGATAPLSSWVTMRVTGVSGVIKIYQDGVETASGSTAGQTIAANTGTRCLWSPDGSLGQSIKACDYRLVGPGGTITARLDEGAGTTITNSTGANGTLTDASPANFWYAAWVPE